MALFRSAVIAAALLLPATASAQHALAAGGPYDPAIPTPQSVLGYDVGERFTPHHLLMRYVERLAAASRRLHVDTVATTFEGREVLRVTVTSEANQRRLAELQSDAARLADPRGDAARRATAIERSPVIVWLGFTVHGPEASGVEAAIALLYQLAAGQDAATRRILDSAVVLIDPLQNPDGHERHAQDVMRMRTALGVPVHPQSRIHAGTWPGPRTSHYHFDLNRDWYAQSHPETRGRVATMLTWWPHVAVDLHEMSTNSTYFFAPPMAPVNKLVHPNIQQWWNTFAQGNIAAFDAHGWSYFRREGYDEFYPGYGSSWPIYAGAVGMTYEQATTKGGAIRRSDGTILTLAEAARHHYAAAWATLGTAAANARARVRDYAEFRRTAIDDARRAPMRAVALAPDRDGRADSLASKLRQNGIEVQRLRAATRVAGATAFGDARASAATLPAGSYLVDLAQPQGRLARALLEPDAPLDSAFIDEELARRRAGMSERFYDMTAWALPYSFRVQAWALPSVPGGAEPVGTIAGAPASLGVGRYGYAIAPGSAQGLRMLAGLLADSVRVWYAPRSFRAGPDSFPHGAWIVRAAANDSGMHGRVQALARSTGARVAALQSAAADDGTDLGSNSVIPLRAPRVALLAGAPIGGQSYGYAWYAFDQRLRYPTTALEVDALSGALDDFNVLVIPSTSAGALARALGDAGRDRIASWVRAGGLLVTIEDATDWLASERTGLARLRVRRDSARADSSAGAPLPAEVPGAIVRASIDTLSPLTAGMDAGDIPVQYFSGRLFSFPKDVRAGEAVVRYAPLSRLRLAGYLWPEVPARLAESPYLWTERIGRGRVIGFAADPNFRDLWPGLLPLFGNAVLMGGSF